MTRRAWTWGAGLLLAGAVVLGLALHAIADYDPGAGSPDTATLGQVVSVILGGGLLMLGLLVVGTGLRRRAEARRRRRPTGGISTSGDAHRPRARRLRG